MKPPRYWLLCGFWAGLAVGGVWAAGTESIAVSATAVQGYVRPVDAAGKPRPESYVFAEGKFFGGTTADAGLAKMSFTDITRQLAISLAKQNYFPTKEAGSADLLIMVHWGATTGYEDPQAQITQEAAQAAASNFSAAQAATGMADPTALNFELGALATSQQSARAVIDRNAVLLGYARNLAKERKNLMATTAETALSYELIEERYFVILLAYDQRAFKADRQAKPRWITRLSVRSPGNNFVEALPALARVGSEVYGRQVDDLTKVRTNVGPGSVKLHDLEVLGASDQVPAAPEKK